MRAFAARQPDEAPFEQERRSLRTTLNDRTERVCSSTCLFLGKTRGFQLLEGARRGKRCAGHTATGCEGPRS